MQLTILVCRLPAFGSILLLLPSVGAHVGGQCKWWMPLTLGCVKKMCRFGRPGVENALYGAEPIREIVFITSRVSMHSLPPSFMNFLPPRGGVGVPPVSALPRH